MSVLAGFDPSWRRVHLVGVGGAGMSAIARVLAAAGHEVSGSDLRDSAVLGALRALGLRVHVGHRATNMQGADLVIASAAVPEDNPEVLAAQAEGIPVLSRGEALARVVRGRTTIAVSGTHGKTTTSGMIATVLVTADLDPTYLLGSDLARGGPGGRLGGGDLAVVEADEAYGSFLWLRPDVALVTNVDADHLDFYGTMAALEAAFVEFVSRTSSTVVLCADDPGSSALAPVAEDRGTTVVTYGFSPGAAVRAERLVQDAHGSRFTLVVGEQEAGTVTLSIAGRHNVRNALGAAAASLAAGLGVADVVAGLGAFRGARRRFEFRGRMAGADLVDDYAHHPAEIEATLEAARSGPWSRVVAVFQPHLYSRTQALRREFGEALAKADVVVVTDVYGAREEPMPGVTGKLVADAVCEVSPRRRVAYLPRLDDAAVFVRDQVRPGDLVLSLGAGDVTTLHDRLCAGAGVAG
jgi:UDP-N-acetylmuramate--alanine ligase